MGIAESAAGDKLPAVTLRYGLFINTIIDFLIVAFTIFVVVRTVNKHAHWRQSTAPTAKTGG